MRCIAHRGFAGVYPENTLTAIRQAAGQADMIEIDVRRCGSGELVVFHDETIDRVTDRSGRVSDLSAAELADLDVAGSGEGVPTLQAVLQNLPADTGLDIELKEPGLVEDVRDHIADFENEIWLSSFEKTVLETAGEQTDVPLILLVSDNSEAGIERAVGLDCNAIAPHWRTVDFALIERAHRSGLDVYVWTIEEAEKAQSLSKMGVDGVIADKPTACVDS